MARIGQAKQLAEAHEGFLGVAIEVAEAEVTLGSLPAGTIISVKAVNERGMEGWDWARVRMEE